MDNDRVFLDVAGEVALRIVRYSMRDEPLNRSMKLIVTKDRRAARRKTGPRSIYARTRRGPPTSTSPPLPTLPAPPDNPTTRTLLRWKETLGHCDGTNNAVGIAGVEIADVRAAMAGRIRGHGQRRFLCSVTRRIAARDDDDIILLFFPMLIKHDRGIKDPLQAQVAPLFVLPYLLDAMACEGFAWMRPIDSIIEELRSWMISRVEWATHNEEPSTINHERVIAERELALFDEAMADAKRIMNEREARRLLTTSAST